MRDAAEVADPEPKWIERVERLSALCDEGTAKTHIAFLGVAMLARATDGKADLFALKPKHAKDNPSAISLRTLAEGVLVPIAAELGISLGVTGGQPLNNQPYFRMVRLGDGTPVHEGGRAAFDYMLQLVHELQAADPAVAQAALAAYVAVRRRYQPRYESSSVDASIAAERLAAVISAFVEANSEGGRRAQAVVAGLLDIAFGTDRIVTGRINDPSRKHPGDICVKGEQDVTDDEPQWEKSIEVRDKRAGPIRLNSEPGPISGFSAVRKRRIGHAAGLCTAGRFGRLRRTGNRPAVHNPCGVPRSSLKPLS